MADDPQSPTRRFVLEAAEVVRSSLPQAPTVALILGSGLGNFADELEDPITIPGASIPHYPRSTVQGHQGKLVFGTVSSSARRSPPLLIFQGRTHFYEQGELAPVVFPVYLAKELGATTLIATNAAGGLNRSFHAGDFMLLESYLNLTFLRIPFQAGDVSSKQVSPVDRRREQEAFDPGLESLFLNSARKLGIKLAKGVYCWLKGPTYETAAEIEMLSRIGADAVGMSTVPEIVAANSLEMRVAAISLISNLATGLAEAKLSHHEVTETAARVQGSFTTLMKEVLLQIGEHRGGTNGTA